MLINCNFGKDLLILYRAFAKCIKRHNMGSKEKGVLYLVIGFIIIVANILMVADEEQLTLDGTPNKTAFVAGRITAIILFWILAIYLVWKGRKLYREAE
jgi:hypothetical protein